jgi:hypothetical protein
LSPKTDHPEIVKALEVVGAEAGVGAAGTAAGGLVWEMAVRARNIIEATIRMSLVIVVVIGLPQYRYKDF